MTNSDTITLPIQLLLDHLLYSFGDNNKYKLDRCAISVELGKCLESHAQHNVSYHVEYWSHSHATLWHYPDWLLFAEHEYNLSKYWETKHKLKQAQEFASLTPKQQLRIKIEEQKKAGNMTAVAMMEWAYSMMKGK